MGGRAKTRRHCVASACQLCQVVGGADKGGILVRKGQDLKSEQLADRRSARKVSLLVHAT